MKIHFYFIIVAFFESELNGHYIIRIDPTNSPAKIEYPNQNIADGKDTSQNRYVHCSKTDIK